MTTRGRKPRPGRITFVGSGPGDPGLLTTRAATVLANAALVFTDPDVPEPVLALIGNDLPPVSGPAPADPVAANADGGTPGTGGGCGQATPAVMSGGPDIRPALGDPAEVAKTLIAEARSGADVVRLVAGDPLSVDAVITEVNAVARSHLHFEIVPGLAATTRRPDLRGAAAGLVAHRRRRARRRGLGGAGRGSRAADPAGHSIASGRCGAHPDRAWAGRDHAVRGDRARHHLPAAFGGNHAGGFDRLGRAGRYRHGAVPRKRGDR